MTNKKTFRLQQILDAFTLSGQKAPAMITLKKWSQDGVFDNCHTPVSYTHLDVYKRQWQNR